MATTTIHCTVMTVGITYPYGVQADDTTAAALTAIDLAKAATETSARQAALSALLPGDLRNEFPEGSDVVVTVTAVPAKAAGTGPQKPGP